MPSNYHMDVSVPAAASPSGEQLLESIVADWLDQLQMIFSDDSLDNLSCILHADSWWRDMLVLDWDFHTIRGLAKITKYILHHRSRGKITNIRLMTEGSTSPVLETPQIDTTWIRAIFTFECQCGSGLGVVYLTRHESQETWKAFSVYMALQTIRGSEFRTGSNRPEGTSHSLSSEVCPAVCNGSHRGRDDLQKTNPKVVVIGAGQSGLNVSARLQSMGISCLVIEQNERVGDNWRRRYRTLVTHDHVDLTHLAYLPFPKNWPKYSHKDKLGDWFEFYANVMQLKIWLKSTLKSAEYNDQTQLWTVTILRDGEERVIQPRHLIWCAGQFGAEKIPGFPTQYLFAGTIYHSKYHQDAALMEPRGKKVVVVGTGNSGHDIAQDYFENGAQVTLLQRGGTYVLGQNGLPLLPENVFVDDDSMPIGIKDLLSESLAWPVTLALCRENTRKIMEADMDLLLGLESSGFKLDYGPGGQGILSLYIHRGGGYFIDFGCSQLIIHGKVKVVHCPEGITGFEERQIILGDGSRLEADIIVLATGYHGPLESARRVLGPKVVERCDGEIWGLDVEGEVRAMWRPSGHPGLWFMGGNLAQARVYSGFVALQIAAREIGLV